MDLCVNCGQEPACAETAPTAAEAEEPVVFSICGTELRFPSAYRAYTEKRSVCFEKALAYCDGAYANVRKLETESDDYDGVLEALRAFGAGSIGEAVRLCHRFLLDEGVYAITEETLLNRCGGIVVGGGFARQYDALEEAYLAAAAGDAATQEYRRRKEDARTRWRNSGAGQDAGDAFPGIGDLLPEGDYRSERRKYALLRGRTWSEELYIALTGDMSHIFDCAYRIYSKEKNVPAPQTDPGRRRLYIEEALKPDTTPERYVELHLRALREFPFSRWDYWRLLCALGPAEHGVLGMMEYFLPQRFLLAGAAAVRAAFAEQMARCPEGTQEEIDRKLARMDRLREDIRRESACSTACREYLYADARRFAEARGALLEKRAAL